MYKRLFFAVTLVTLTLIASAGAGLASSWRGGGLFGASPELVTPATADLYVALDRGGGQSAALNYLWEAYRSYPGTGAAVDRLLAGMTAADQQQLSALVSALGDRTSVAVWAPATAAGTTRFAVITQLKATNILSAMGPLSSLIQLSVDTAYDGITIYRASFNGGGSGYAAVVDGDGVVTMDLPTIESVVDTATYRAPSLASDALFQQAIAGLPATRLLTVYVSPSYLQAALRASRANGMALSPQLMREAQALSRPLAVAVTAQSDGFSIVSSATPLPAGATNLTPNAGAGIVGSNAVLYESLDNLAALLMAPGVLPARAISRLQMQTGIAIERDVLPLLSHEVVVDLNDETTPLVLALTQIRGSSSGQTATTVPGAIPTLPGSLELGMWVANPVAGQQALLRVAHALLKMLAGAGQGGIVINLVRTTLPDGSIAYVLPILPGVGFMVRGHWLLISTNVTADVQQARAPLAADPAYQFDLAHVGGPGALYSVSYLNTRRLLRVVDAWLAFIKAQQSHMAPSQRLNLSGWRQAEPFIRPFRSIMAVTRQVGGNAEQSTEIISLGP